jgi:ferric-dicitrate binding protein FerR (iron transport regulator)
MRNVKHDGLEDLLRHASPRPAPAPEAVAAAREALRDEWREVAGKRRMRRRVPQYAIAATVLAGMFAVFNVLRMPVVAPVQVATIEKSFGSVYLLGEQAELRETTDLSSVLSGQTIVTGDDAGLALAWGNGGSLRIDGSTRIRFSADEDVFLESGRIYFDSQYSTLIAGIDTGSSDPAFRIRTDLGDVSHMGTQYMTEVERESLVVSVREGEVAIAGKYHDHTVSSGQQVTLAGQQQPSILNIASAGAMWSWVNQTTPIADVDGKTLHEFLVWVCREMGLDLEFEGQAETVARGAILKGRIDTAPADALRLRLATTDLRSRIDGGTIYISENR